MMVQTYLKKRIEIILEAPALHRLTDRLDKAGVTGYTIVPVLAGRGGEGAWSAEGLAGDAGRLVMIISIVDASKADDVLERVYTLLSRQIGIVTVSDVQVIRADHF
jgi:nitrogen regulatory protein PII